MEQPGNGSDAACDLARAVAHRLRSLATGKFFSTHPFISTAEWLERSASGASADHHAWCRRLAAGMLAHFQMQRQEKWLEYVGHRQEPWAQWVDRAVWRAFLVDSSWCEGDGLLRTAGPPSLYDLLDLHRKYAGDPREYRELGLPLAGLIPSGLKALIAGVEEDRQSVPDAFHKACDTLERKLPASLGPPPEDAPRLRECLQSLFRPREPLCGWGCLTWDCEVRLFQWLPKLAAPCLGQHDFDRLQEPIENLRSWIDGTTRKPLEWVLEQLDVAGEAAKRLAAVLAPWPTPPGHRLWAACFLENLRCLGELARHTRPQPETPAEADSTPAPPAVSDDGRTEETSAPDLDLVAAAPSSPEAPTAGPETELLPVEPAKPALSAEEKHLAELVRVYPEHVGSLEEIARLAVERIALTRIDWAEAAHALEGLRAKCQQHREWLLKHTAGKPPAACDSLVKPRTVSLTDELLNNLKQLDGLLPGQGEDAPLPPDRPAGIAQPRRQELCRQVKEVRDRLFRFMEKHGGYRHYPVEIGDTTTKHGGNLHLAGPSVPARRVDQGHVAQIVRPGYVVQRQSHCETKVYPSVRLAN